MLHRKPSLTALRVFAVASTTENFTTAAGVLRLSQSAVSRHVQNLEFDIGVPLFARSGRRLKLTAEGKELSDLVTSCFDKLDGGLENFRRARARASLRVSLLPSLAAYWLSPVLSGFAAEHPDMELMLDCSRVLADFKNTPTDIAIRYGAGGWPNVRAEPLMTEFLTPVCSPAWRERIGPDPSLSRLAGLPLIFGDYPETWDDYFAKFGVRALDNGKRTTISDDNVLIQTCLRGHGFILGRGALVTNALKSGDLIAPFRHAIPASYRYWIVTPPGDYRHPAVTAFVDYLKAQAASDAEDSAFGLIGSAFD